MYTLYSATYFISKRIFFIMWISPENCFYKSSEYCEIKYDLLKKLFFKRTWCSLNKTEKLELQNKLILLLFDIFYTIKVLSKLENCAMSYVFNMRVGPF